MARPIRLRGNLPAEVTSFVGRRHELAAVKHRLTEMRLVDLVGPGGVGKTRLAIRAAADLGRAFRDGVWLVALGELDDPALVANAFVSALGLRAQSEIEPIPMVLQYVGDKQLLLVVDNCEHLLDAAGRLVAEVLSRAPGVRVIATSREPLSIRGESVLPVPPLELPSTEGVERLDQLRHNEAVALFVQRALAASGRFDLTAGNRSAVVDLCRRLDGLPLGIELAAARPRVLTAAQILERLSDRFAVLVGGSRGALPRQHTLRMTIDWSHDLLTAGEQALLRRLSVFAGRFTLEDVEGVCRSGDPLESPTLEPLSSLVDKSLLVKDDGGSVAWYRMHETMREYARIKLEEAGEGPQFASRCLAYYLRRCRRSPQESSSGLSEWLEWMDLELDNVRSILGSCLVRKDFASGIELAVSLGWYWITRAAAEGVRWLDALLASESTHPALAWAYLVRGYLGVLQGDPAGAKTALDKALAEARAAREPAVIAPSLSLASMAANMAGDHPSAARLLDESRRAVLADDLPARLTFLQARCLNAFFEGDLDAVRSAASQGIRLSRETGADSTLDLMLINLGFAALSASDMPEAKSRFGEALAVARRIDDRVAQYYALGGFACQAAGSGQPRLAARLLGAVETMRAQTGARFNAHFARLLDRAEQSVISSLGPSKFQAEVDTGKALNRDGAFALARGDSSKTLTPTDQPELDQLARRQREVALLVAEGLSNKQIGARLFISEYTVDTHVRTILNKLGFSSRAQIAAWMGPPNRIGIGHERES
jgi:predicted ATPase/DNA-binding CsgD family transcriptional regulator